MVRPSSVLYVCGMNAIRSPMAEAITRQYYPSEIYVASAGIRPGNRDPFVIAVIEEMGIDISHYQPSLLDNLEDDNFDLIITLAPEAHHRALEITRSLYVKVEYWPTADPSEARGSREQILDSYRAVRDGLSMRIKQRFDQ